VTFNYLHVFLWGYIIGGVKPSAFCSLLLENFIDIISDLSLEQILNDQMNLVDELKHVNIGKK